MRSAAAFAAVAALFAGTLVGGLHYMGAFDPDMLRGPQEDHLGEARAGWKVHSHTRAGFSVQLPPEWEAAEAAGATVFRELDRKRRVVAELRITRVDEASQRTSPSNDAATRFVKEGHVLTFRTPKRLSASYGRIFDEAAKSFHAIGRAA